jgi:hypothetical protein
MSFGCGRSVLWFTKLMRPVVKYIRSELGYRLLPWIDDFLCAPTDGRRPATGRDCRRARIRLDAIFRELGLTLHPEKGCWEGSQVVEHLKVLLDTQQMRVFVTERKTDAKDGAGDPVVCKAKPPAGFTRKAETFLWSCSFAIVGFALGHILHPESLLGCKFGWIARGGERAKSKGGSERGPSVSAQRGPRERAPRDAGLTWQHRRPLEPQWDKVRLSRQSLRGLAYWRSLTRGERRDLHPLPADLTMHSDAADVGYGGTLGMCTASGYPGLWEGRGLWTTEERARSITLC